MLFKDAKEVLKIRYSPKFSRIMAMTPCVMIIAEAQDEEVLPLIEMVNDQSIERKYLYLITPELNASTVQNITINFNIVVDQRCPGGQVITSLCPVLGKRYAQSFNGECPNQADSIHGKTLNISFIGPEPFITYNPVGGSDFLIINLLANKFQFTPNFIPERSFELIESNGTSQGLVFRVSEVIILSMFIWPSKFNHPPRFQQNKAC